jgi:hypothetical protein
MVGPGRSWPPPTDGWPAVPFLHGIKDTAIRDQAGTVLQEELLKDGQSRRDNWESGPRSVLYKDSLKASIWEEMTHAAEIQQWHKGPRPETRATSGEQRDFYEALGQSIGLEVTKRAVEFSIRLQKMSDWTLWRGRPPPKRKKRSPKHSPRKSRMVVVHPDQLAPYQGTTWDKRP